MGMSFVMRDGFVAAPPVVSHPGKFATMGIFVQQDRVRAQGTLAGFIQLLVRLLFLIVLQLGATLIQFIIVAPVTASDSRRRRREVIRI